MLLILEVMLIVLSFVLPVVRFLRKVVALVRIQGSIHSSPHVTGFLKSSLSPLSAPVPASARCHTTPVLSINPVKLSQSSSSSCSEDEATEAILQDFLKKRGITDDFNCLPESLQYRVLKKWEEETPTPPYTSSPASPTSPAPSALSVSLAARSRTHVTSPLRSANLNAIITQAVEYQRSKQSQSSPTYVPPQWRLKLSVSRSSAPVPGSVSTPASSLSGSSVPLTQSPLLRPSQEAKLSPSVQSPTYAQHHSRQGSALSPLLVNSIRPPFIEHVSIVKGYYYYHNKHPLAARLPKLRHTHRNHCP